jgi:hypothetical protein
MEKKGREEGRDGGASRGRRAGICKTSWWGLKGESRVVVVVDHSAHAMCILLSMSIVTRIEKKKKEVEGVRAR